MYYDDNFYYAIIDKYEFDKRYLLGRHDDSKYTLVYYKDDNVVKSKCLDDVSSCSDDIIKSYEVEEIISQGDMFDSEYELIIYYKIDETYFIKYKPLFLVHDNNNEEIKEFFKQLNNVE